MMSRLLHITCTAASVIRMSIPGHIPAVYMATVRMDMGMIAPVSGRAMRFDSRKYFGNVPKQIYASGPVVS